MADVSKCLSAAALALALVGCGGGLEPTMEVEHTAQAIAGPQAAPVRPVAEVVTTPLAHGPDALLEAFTAKLRLDAAWLAEQTQAREKETASASFARGERPDGLPQDPVPWEPRPMRESRDAER